MDADQKGKTTENLRKTAQSADQLLLFVDLKSLDDDFDKQVDLYQHETSKRQNHDARRARRRLRIVVWRRRSDWSRNHRRFVLHFGT